MIPAQSELPLPAESVADRLARLRAATPLPEANPRDALKLVLHLALHHQEWQFNNGELLVAYAAHNLARITSITKKESYPVVCTDCGRPLGNCITQPVLLSCGCQGHGFFVYGVERIAAAAQGERYNIVAWKELAIVMAEVLTEWHTVKQILAQRKESRENGTDTDRNNTAGSNISPANGGYQQS